MSSPPGEADGGRSDDGGRAEGGEAGTRGPRRPCAMPRPRGAGGPRGDGVTGTHGAHQAPPLQWAREAEQDSFLSQRRRTLKAVELPACARTGSCHVE